MCAAGFDLSGYSGVPSAQQLIWVRQPHAYIGWGVPPCIGQHCLGVVYTPCDSIASTLSCKHVHRQLMVPSSSIDVALLLKPSTVKAPADLSEMSFLMLVAGAILTTAHDWPALHHAACLCRCMHDTLALLSAMDIQDHASF